MNELFINPIILSSDILNIIDKNLLNNSISNDLNNYKNDKIEYIRRINSHIVKLRITHEIIDIVFKKIDSYDKPFRSIIKSDIWKNNVNSLKHYVDLAKSKIIEANLRIVIMFARKYNRFRKNNIFEDLIQEGNLGLIKATEKFSIDRGNRFMTYASWWVKHFIRRTVMGKNDVIKIPLNLIELSLRLSKIEENCLLMTGKNIDDSELIVKSGISKSKLEIIRNYRIRSSVSLDTMISDYENEFSSTYAIKDNESKNPEEIFHDNELSKNLMKLLDILTPIELNVIKLRFAINCEKNFSCREIGKIFNLSGEGIRQLEKRAIRKLKNGSEQLNFFNEF